MRQILRRIPLACLSVFLVCDRRCARGGAVLRTEQGPVQDKKFEVLKTDHFECTSMKTSAKALARRPNG